MPQRPSYIITGGAGFIGSNLAAELLARQPGAGISIVDDFSSGSFTNLVAACRRKGVGPFTGEVIARPTAEVSIAGLIEDTEPSAVFHLAAITDTTVSDESRMIRANSGEDWPLIIDACVQADLPLVYASSAATYGNPLQTAAREPFPEDAAGSPSNVYGFSKWLMECEHRRLDQIRREAGEPRAWVVGLRYFNVFGPGEGRKAHMASMVHQVTRQLLAGKRPRLFTGGEQARDHVYVDDVVDCTLAAAGLGERARIEPGIFNLGSGRATTFNELVEAVRTALGLSAEERATKYFDMPDDVRAFYQEYTCADLSRTTGALGWAPAHDPLEAMRQYALYLRENA